MLQVQDNLIKLRWGAVGARSSRAMKMAKQRGASHTEHRHAARPWLVHRLYE